MDSPYIALIVAALGAVWTFFKSTEWFRKHCEVETALAAEILAGNTTKTYIEDVRPAKEASPDGKLTGEQKTAAMARTLAATSADCAARGIDFEKVIGILRARPKVEELVQRLKRKL